MNQKIKQQLRASLCSIVIVIASLTLTAAKADNPPRAGGTWNDCNVITDVRTVGENTIVTVTITETFTGTFDGSYVGTERDVIYADGSATFHGNGVFTGQVSNKSGTVRMTYVGVAPAGGTGLAQWVVDQGTGGLANLYGRGTFEGTETGPTDGCDDTFAGTYAGELKFAP